MRPTAPTTALLALTCVQLLSAAALAKPTKPLAHESPHRPVVAVSSRPAAPSPHTAASRSMANHSAGGSEKGIHAAGTVAHNPPTKITSAKVAPKASTASSHHVSATARPIPLKLPSSASPISQASQHPQSLHPSKAASSTAATTVASKPVADAATIRRVHAWEQAQHGITQSNDAARPAVLTANNPPAPAHTAQIPRTAATASRLADTQSSENLEDDSTESVATLNDSSGVLRPTTNLPSIPSIEQEAAPLLFLPSLYDARGQLVIPPPLYGSHDVLLHQNEMADRDGLSRVQDDAELLELLRQNKLVALPENEGIHVDEGLPADRRFSRPWTADFLAVLGRDFYANFHSQLLVDSAVRTVAIQKHLLRINRNAAPASGDTASPHLTGQAVDIAKHGLTRTQIAWMRTYLEPLILQGKIDVEEEFQQSCFHISVYRNYLLPTLPHIAVTVPRAAAPTPED